MLLISVDQTALPYSRELCFAGAACEVQTTSPELTGVLQLLSGSAETFCGGRFSMRLVVDESSNEVAGEPHFRGLHHVVTASFGRSNVFVFDVLRRTVAANVSGIVARDYRFWKERLIPIALGVLGSAMGLVPVHCACLELDGDGVLIAGASGAGKSTLSVAMAENGFAYVSDDWTYVSQVPGGIVAHGTSAPVKLLPDAVEHFSDLRHHKVHTSMNGELAYEVDMAETFRVQAAHECEPRWLIFLERMEREGAEFTPMSSAETRRYVRTSVERLPKQLQEAASLREQTIEGLAKLPCWRLRYGGTPRFAAEQLREFVVQRRQEVFA
jgi:hypothetical protein